MYQTILPPPPPLHHALITNRLYDSNIFYVGLRLNGDFKTQSLVQSLLMPSWEVGLENFPRPHLIQGTLDLFSYQELLAPEWKVGN